MNAVSKSRIRAMAALAKLDRDDPGGGGHFCFLVVAGKADAWELAASERYARLFGRYL